MKRIQVIGLHQGFKSIVYCAVALLLMSCDDNGSTDEHEDDDETSSISVEKFICKPREIVANAIFAEGCSDPIPIPDRAGKESGFVCCADGSINREQKKTLSRSKDDECAADEDCKYEDKMCIPGTLAGDDHPNICTFDGCKQNDKCAEYECGVVYRMGPLCPGTYPVASCRTEFDECRVDDVCGEGEFCGLVRTELEENSEKVIFVWECKEADECID